MATKTQGVKLGRQPKQYPISQSPFFKLQNRRKLADILQFPLPELQALAECENSYKEFKLAEITDPLRKPRKPRQVQEPIVRLAAVHKRMHRLLSRVALPDYLHSARRSKSYISNAASHLVGERVLKVDIKDFFPSVKSFQVFKFFRDTMLCSSDVAGLLTKLCTYNGALPTGGALSPLLSFFVHRSLFDDLDQFAKIEALVFTCYVDDLVFSGNTISNRTARDVECIVSRHGLHVHKKKTRIYRRGSARLITGVVVKQGVGLTVPHDRFNRIRRVGRALRGTSSESERLKLLERYVGMLGEASQIEARFSGWMRMELSELKRLRANKPPSFKLKLKGSRIKVIAEDAKRQQRATKAFSQRG